MKASIWFFGNRALLIGESSGIELCPSSPAVPARIEDSMLNGKGILGKTPFIEGFLCRWSNIFI
jgi:hypothetical protein